MHELDQSISCFLLVKKVALDSEFNDFLLIQIYISFWNCAQLTVLWLNTPVSQHWSLNKNHSNEKLEYIAQMCSDNSA